MTLQIDRVSKTYFRGDQTIAALDDASIEVGPGELVGVVGGRGSGKTTLLRVAAGLERPDAGRVLLDGARVDQMSDRELTQLRREQLSCVWGDVANFGGAKALDLVALPLRLNRVNARSARAEGLRVLERLGVGSCADAEIDQLSGGERKLIGIAQALVTKPRFLLLDHPAADLSVAEELTLLDVLRALAEDSGVAILLTARMSSEATAAGRVASISRGRILTGARASAEPDEADVIQFDPLRRGAAQGGEGA